MGGLAVLADPLIRAVLGTKWIAAIPIFQILAPVGLVQSVQTLVGSIYVAKGRTDWMFRWGLFVCVVLVTAFLVGVQFGSIGVAVSYCAVYFALLVYPGFAIPFRLIGLRFTDFALALLPQLVGTLVMIAICWAWLHLLRTVAISNPWVQLISTSLLGVASYTVAILSARPPVVRHIEQLVKESQRRSIIKVWYGLQRLFRKVTADDES